MDRIEVAAGQVGAPRDRIEAPPDTVVPQRKPSGPRARARGLWPLTLAKAPIVAKVPSGVARKTVPAPPEPPVAVVP